MTTRNIMRVFFYAFIILILHVTPTFADTIVGGRISADTTWTLANSPYLVTSAVQVYGTTSTPVTLTIEPGVVVKFNSGIGLQIGSGANLGALVSHGTDTSRITFSRSGTSGNWSTITFNDGTVDGATLLEKVDIQYSGGVVMYSASPTIRNSTITDVNGYGLNLSASNPTIDTVTITNNSNYGIYLSSSSPTITNGSLSNTNTTGHGIYGSGSPVISNYSVSIVNRPGGYGLYISSATSALSITNSSISNGISLPAITGAPTITGNTFTNVDNSPIHAGASQIANIMNNNTVIGMTSAGRIEVVGERISQDALWHKWPAPYVVSGTVYVYKDPTTAATLTIEPGTVVKFDAGSGMEIGFSGGAHKGNLVAQGTLANRMTFTRSGTSGTWSGMTFYDGTCDSTTILEYADIQYSTGITMISASPTIRNSTVTNVTGWGMSLYSSNSLLDTVTISNSGGVYGIYLNSSSPTITGVSLTNSTAAGSGIFGSGSPVISNCTVSVVNAAGNYGVYLSSSSSGLSITNSTIGNGMYLGAVNIIPTITGNTFTNYDVSPLRAGANIVASILNNNTFNGMSSAGRIDVIGEQVNQDTRWQLWPAPYIVVSGTIAVYKDSTTPATLTIDPGVTVKFISGAMQVGYSTNRGALVAQGTAANHITFTRNGTTGNWGAFTFNDGTIDNVTVLEYVDIQYSTGVVMNSASPTIRNSTLTNINGYGLSLSSSNPTIDTVTIASSGVYGISLSSSSPVITGGSLTNSNSNGYGIYGTGSPVISNYNISIVNTMGMYGIALTSTTSSLSLTNSTIGNGLYLNTTGITPTITGNTFTNADNSPLRAGANIIDLILDNNTLTGLTAAGRIEINGEQVNRDVRWKKWAAPYYFPNGSAYVYRTDGTTATLTIDPGVTIKFNNVGLQIGGYGSSRGKLVAQGSPENKILFTSSQGTPAPGNWSGVTLIGSAASASVIENVIFEYGGAGAQYNYANLTTDTCSPIIQNCIIRNSAGSGIYVLNAMAWPAIVDSEISTNKWGISTDASNLTIMNTLISGNTTTGVYNRSTTMDVDARGNWWGSASGPRHASNPPGTGDAVSNRVLYNPWLGQAPGSGFGFANARVLPASLNPEGDYVTFAATITSSATWTIVITDNNNAVARTLTGTGAIINQKWFGENDSAVKVPDGAYYYRITAINTTTGETALAPLGLIMVSRQLPIAILDPPVDNQMFRAGETINVTGTASDSVDFRYYTLEYGEGENPSTWNLLVWQEVGITPVTNGLIKSWDTSALTGSIYTLRLTVVDTAGNIAVETSRVRFLKIQNAAVTEPYFSPNGDNVKDTTTINASFTHKSDWTIAIKNSSGAAVKTFTGLATSVTQTWDGRDDQGQLVSEGTYTWTISAVGSGTTTTATPISGAVTVDTIMPLAQITAPANGSVLWNQAPVAGTASDLNLDSYRIEYSPSGSNGPWSVAALGAASVISGPLGTWVTNDAMNAVLVANGNYDLRLIVIDKAGNYSTAAVPVSVNNLILSNVSASSHTLNTQTNDVSMISYTINGPATVSFKIIPEKEGSAGTPVRQTSQAVAAAGTYSFAWDGKDNTGNVVPDEAYIYVLEAADGTKTDSYAPAATGGGGTLACTQDTYDPYKNDPMIITYSLSQPARVNITASWVSQQYPVIAAIPQAAGSHTVTWDGRSLSGNIIAPNADATCAIASLLGENHIITSGDTPEISNLSVDPYVMKLTYGHVARISYSLQRDALVTITLISPSGASIPALENVYQTAGSHTLQDWSGLDAADSTGKRLLISEEGMYKVIVRAANPQTGNVSTLRGSLNIGY